MTTSDRPTHRHKGSATDFAEGRAAGKVIEDRTRASAARTIAGHALGADDCRELLAMLGLSAPSRR